MATISCKSLSLSLSPFPAFVLIVRVGAAATDVTVMTSSPFRDTCRRLSLLSAVNLTRLDVSHSNHILLTVTLVVSNDLNTNRR